MINAWPRMRQIDIIIALAARRLLSAFRDYRGYLVRGAWAFPVNPRSPNKTPHCRTATPVRSRKSTTVA